MLQISFLTSKNVNEPKNVNLVQELFSEQHIHSKLTTVPPILNRVEHILAKEIL